MKQEAKYVFNIWLTSAIVGSTLFFWGSYWFDKSIVLHGGSLKDITIMYVLTILSSLFLSLPALLLLWLSTYALTRKKLSLMLIKALVALICVILCALTFAVFPPTDFSYKDLILIGYYSIPLVAGVFLYKLR